MSDRPRDGGKFSEVFHYSEGLCDQITRLSSLTRTAPKLTSHQKLQPRVLAELRWLSTFYLLTLLSEFFLFETFKLRIQRGFPRSSPHKNPGGSLQTFSVCFLIRHFQFPSSEPALPSALPIEANIPMAFMSPSVTKLLLSSDMLIHFAGGNGRVAFVVIAIITKPHTQKHRSDWSWETWREWLNKLERIEESDFNWKSVSLTSLC